MIDASNWTKVQRAELRRYVTTLRRTLEPFDGWPRDARAWARRDRIDALLSRMEAERFGATRSDPARFLRMVEELRAWLTREQEFVRTYPILSVPGHWTSRDLSPAAKKRLEREWRAHDVREISRQLAARRGSGRKPTKPKNP